jgi:hypothetical protein
MHKLGVHGRTILKWIFRQERGDRITRTLGRVQRPFNVDLNRKADDLSAFSRRIQINELSNLVHDQRVRQHSGYNFMDVLNPRNL